jgi:hypothetical protein
MENIINQTVSERPGPLLWFEGTEHEILVWVNFLMEKRFCSRSVLFDGFSLFLLSLAFRFSNSQVIILDPRAGTVVQSFVGKARALSISASAPNAVVAGVVNPAVGIPRNVVLNCQSRSSSGCSSYTMSFTPAPDQAGQNYSLCIAWSAFPNTASPVSGCVTISVTSPQPVIVQPSGSWYYGGRIFPNSNPVTYSFRANVGCLMSVPLKAMDSVVDSPYEIILKPLVRSSFPPSPSGLPQGGIEQDGAASLERSRDLSLEGAFDFRWRPARGQESSKHYQVCFEASDRDGFIATVPVGANLAARSVCFRILVQKCQYCVQPGDSFGSIAAQYNTDWLHIYTANPTVLDPDNLVPYTRINTGVFYQVQKVIGREKLWSSSYCIKFLTSTPQSNPERVFPQGDSATALAKRFFTTLDSLQSVNPDIALDQVGG